MVRQFPSIQFTLGGYAPQTRRVQVKAHQAILFIAGANFNGFVSSSA